MSDLLKQLDAAQSDEEREWLVMEFSLDNLDPKVRDAVWVAAIPQWFDRNFVAALLEVVPDKDFDRQFETLVSLSFVEVFQGRGFNIHERSRNLLLRNLWQNDQTRYRQLNERAFNYCLLQDQDIVHWRIATLYHFILASPSPSLEPFVNQLFSWKVNYLFDYIETLVRPLLAEASQNRVSQDAAAWIYFFQGTVDTRYSRYAAAKQSYNLALERSTDTALRSEALSSIGETEYMLDEYEAAKQHLNDGLILARQINDKANQINCLRIIGEIHRWLDEHQSSKKAFEEARELCNSEDSLLGRANLTASLGLLNFDMGDLDAAEALLDEALSEFQQIGSVLGRATSLRVLGEIELRRGNHTTARQRVGEALQLYEQVNSRHGQAQCMDDLARLDFAIEDYDSSILHMQQAVDLFKEIGDTAGEGQSSRALEVIRLESLKRTEST